MIVGAAHLPAACPKSKTERQGLRSRLRRPHRQAAVDLPYHPATRRVRQRHLGERFVDVHRQHRRVGADLGRRRARPRLSAGRDCRPATTTAGTGRATICSARAWSPLDLKTGKRIWHYQLVHHGIWDYGSSLRADPGGHHGRTAGRSRRSRSRPSRRWSTSSIAPPAQPVWPIEERPVPRVDVPGEKTSPTQPFPTKPPAFDRQGISVDDLIDFTPELKAEALKMVDRATSSARCSRRRSSARRGPARHADAAVDDRRRELAGRLVRSRNRHRSTSSRTRRFGAWAWSPIRKRSDMDFIDGAARDPAALRHGRRRHARRWRRTERAAAGLTVQGLPLVKPPWGRITAIDLNKGDDRLAGCARRNAWTPSAIIPRSRASTIPRTGRTGRIGTLVTKTLVIAGEGGFFTTPTASAARCCAPTTKPPARMPALFHAGAANRLADDIHAERQAIHRRRHQRRQLFRRTGRVQATWLNRLWNAGSSWFTSKRNCIRVLSVRSPRSDDRRDSTGVLHMLKTGRRQFLQQLGASAVVLPQLRPAQLGATPQSDAAAAQDDRWSAAAG